jgi:hypothetical protein
MVGFNNYAHAKGTASIIRVKTPDVEGVTTNTNVTAEDGGKINYRDYAAS